jgi:hypothetical protein
MAKRHRVGKSKVTSSATDQQKLVELAIGRIFRLGSRPARPGDVEEYERCRAVILDATEPATSGWTPNYARDRFKGATGEP